MVLSYREVGRERGRNELGKEGIQKEGGGTEGRRRGGGRKKVLDIIIIFSDFPIEVITLGLRSRLNSRALASKATGS